MNIHAITFAYALADDLERIYEALPLDVTWHIFLHSRRSDVTRVFNKLARQKNVVSYPYGEDRGLGRSFNEGMYAAYHDGADMIFSITDDAYPGAGDYERLVNAAYEHPEAYTVTGMGMHGDYYRDIQMAFGAITPLAVRELGYFDENFFPVYYADVDWYYRAKLLGLQSVCLEDTNIRHIGSQSVAVDPVAAAIEAEQNRLNKEHYIRKWGGEPGQEQYQHPFNNPAIPLFIPYSRRHNPYPSYARADLEII